MAHTYATLAVSEETYLEIRNKLLAVDYGHTLIQSWDGEVIDMHGIALNIENVETNKDDNTTNNQ